MLIVADENIPLLDSFFDDIGDIRRVSGRHMSPTDVADADILLVRSVTPVNAGLLEGSRVKFVGTATIGTDHVDMAWLADNGITFASAPGCNANSVVEYILSVLSLHAERLDLKDWSELTVGIVGAGNVGGALWRVLDRLGLDVRVSDPLREAKDDEEESFHSLEEVLACDVVTLHTPLTRGGEHPTYHLIDAARLQELRSHQLLINSSRGEVIDEEALLARLDAADAPTVVLDVWDREPAINQALVDRVWLATPHIAGYSLEGKVQGTEMIYQALCRFLGLPSRKQAGQFLPEPPLSKLAFTRAVQAREAADVAIRACYDPRRDDARLRRGLTVESEQRGRVFDRLRRDYPVRREFSSVKIQLKGTSRSLQDQFRMLGFKLKL
ncbi:MAG: 4-phosphoerythronate dehydrogenase PdxB [Marinobacter sp.]|uniref:4-phosphoerythronate dehydrogenase PdxB n=1 Tax=Marinobacter sp. TaxID=50741 RepID=UPI00299E56E3|nr:4-phosphoerythronate dehydrogenase PdxB [Marinobacter sp.]MDX1633003.1 4-phosphoerythronate dehydrogenase PdxB [Marinobacter sp.]